MEDDCGKKLSSFGDPGAARHGNFINYYSFNSVDSRINAIPPELLKEIGLKSDDIVCLDVGCNAGDLTMALYCSLKMMCENLGKNLHVIGIDIDELLIARCIKHNTYPSNVSYYPLDIMSQSAVQILSSLLVSHKKEKFDFITCFSTTMWIHLNHGDQGLSDFLNRLCDITKLILIEPQEWKSYKSAARRAKRNNCDTFNLNSINRKDITAFIDSVLNARYMEKVVSCETSWGRQLHFYKQVRSS